MKTKFTRKILRKYYQQLYGTNNIIRIEERGRQIEIYINKHLDELAVKIYKNNWELLTTAFYTKSGIAVFYGTKYIKEV